VIDGFQGPLRRTLEYLCEAHKQGTLPRDIPFDLRWLQLTEPRFCSPRRGTTSGKHSEIHGLDECNGRRRRQITM
jgi:hypothetical protein